MTEYVPGPWNSNDSTITAEDLYNKATTDPFYLLNLLIISFYENFEKVVEEESNDFVDFRTNEYHWRHSY